MSSFEKGKNAYVKGWSPAASAASLHVLTGAPALASDVAKVGTCLLGNCQVNQNPEEQIAYCINSCRIIECFTFLWMRILLIGIEDLKPK